MFLSGCKFFDNKKEKQFENLINTDSAYALSGNDVIDSLLSVAAIAPLDTNLAKLYYELAEIYEDYDFDKAKEYYLKMGNLCEILDWNDGRFQSAIGFSHTLTRQGMVDESVEVCLQALELAKNLNADLWIGKLFYSLGNAYLVKQWYETALNYYFNAMAIFEKLDKKGPLEFIYGQLSLLYSDIAEVDKAIEYGLKALELSPKEPYFLSSLGNAYKSDQKYEKANEYFERALKLCEIDNNIYLMGWIYYLSSENSLMTFDLNKAEDLAEKAMTINQKIGNISAYLGAYAVLSKVEEMKGNFAKSEEYVLDVLKQTTEIDNKEGLMVCYKLLSELAIAKNDYRSHIQYLKNLDLVEKELIKEKSVVATAELEAKYESTKKEFEIEKQKNIIKTQNTQRNLFIVGILLCLLALGMFWYMMRLNLRRSKALEELNTTKDNFFSIISHDLKNPALAQRNALKMLLDNIGLWDDERLKKYYLSLLKSAEGQVDLLYNLLNWAQMQAGRMPFQPVSFDLVSEFKKTDLVLLQNMAERKGITLNIKLPKTALVTGDVNMVNTILRNLISNSIKFTQPAGRVNLSILLKESGKFLIAISDTGIGMEEEQIKNLFILNQQVSKRGTAGEQGIGLGLIVCKDLLDKHHIRLHVKSIINKGSCFWFEI
jgi:signal transduction histidine kinase/Tfp pilus assembly protein PilF